MTNHCIIQGSFSDYRRIKTRSVMQLIIEVPIEDGLKVISTLGDPLPGEEIPVAVARLRNEIPDNAQGQGGGGEYIGPPMTTASADTEEE